MKHERDNFYDWAKDKPDTTRSSPLTRSTRAPYRAPYRAAPSGSPWARFAMFAAVVIALSVAYHHFFG